MRSLMLDEMPSCKDKTRLKFSVHYISLYVVLWRELYFFQNLFLGYRFIGEILHIDYSFVANSKTIVKLLAYVNYSLKKIK